MTHQLLLERSVLDTPSNSPCSNRTTLHAQVSLPLSARPGTRTQACEGVHRSSPPKRKGKHATVGAACGPDIHTFDDNGACNRRRQGAQGPLDSRVASGAYAAEVIVLEVWEGLHSNHKHDTGRSAIRRRLWLAHRMHSAVVTRSGQQGTADRVTAGTPRTCCAGAWPSETHSPLPPSP